MLKLICDRCGFELKLIHHLDPKREDTNGGDGQGYRTYWDLSNEQDGIGSYYQHDNYFDRDPQEFDKWNWNNGMGTYDEWGIGAHLCHKCKEEYREYVKKYQQAQIDIEEFSAEAALEGKLRLSMKDIKEKLEEHKRRYKEAFLKNKA